MRSFSQIGETTEAAFAATLSSSNYLRRNADADGFTFWLNKLNQFGGNFEQAEMVKAFIVSGEFRDRFPR